MLNARRAVGAADVLLITLDTLRWDVAQEGLRSRRTPAIADLLGEAGWERRHSPATFTLAAHQAFLAGFLPTPAAPGPHPRLFAARFAGSETTVDETWVFDAPDLPAGLAAAGYHTLCVGGVGFFNPASPLGTVISGRFAERHWAPEYSVTSPISTERQVARVLASAAALPPARRLFTLLNVSALHQPNCIFADAAEDSPATQLAALAYADAHLGRLVAGLRRRAPQLLILTSDHGTAYGEDGYRGHRLAHPVVWEVPFAARLLPKEEQAA